MKVIIEDPVKEAAGGKPVDLGENTSIRFEIGYTKIVVEIIEDQLRIKKTSGLNETIEVRPGSGNVIYVK